MKYLLFLTLVLAFVGCQQQKQEAPQDKLEVAKVNLPSMVCGKCAKTIQEAVYKVDGVKEIKVDVDSKTAQVTFLPVRTNIDAIETAITGAGYDANAKKRNVEAYNGLDKCCKIDG